MPKKNIFDFQRMKRRGEKITFLTSYDFPTSRIAEQAGLDMLLVGDSVGMVVYGYTGTLPVTMDQMVCHCQAVRLGAPDTFVIGDMPFLSYQTSVRDAVINAGRMHKEAGVDAVKLEGGPEMAPQVKAMVDAGMLVMGHVGLTPQSFGKLGGFRAQGNRAESAIALLEAAQALQEAGAFSVLVEGVPPETGAVITQRLDIPILGIGAGPECDGQLLIVSDMLGLFQAFTPKFVKKYADLAGEIRHAFDDYVGEIREGKFPGPDQWYPMRKGEAERLEEMVKQLG